MSRDLPRVGLLVNPMARAQRVAPETPSRLEAAIANQGLFALSTGIEDLESIAHHFKDEGVEILAVSGGDGTTSYALTAFKRVYGDTPLPAIALLRGGTMNTVANGLSVPRGRPEALLKRLLGASKKGRNLHSRSVRTIRVNSQLGFITGVGIIPSFLRIYYGDGNPHRSPLTAFKLLAETVGSALVGGGLAARIAAAIACEVSVDGESWPLDSYLTIGAATVPEIGLGFTPFYRIQPGVDGFHIVGFHCTKFEFVKALHPIFWGRPPNQRLTREALASRATVRQVDGPTLYTIDGEVFESNELVIEQGPRVEIVWG